MNATLSLAALLSLALAACGGEPPADTRPTPAAGDPGGGRDVPGDGISDDIDEARYDGVGPARFGMSAAEVRAAWPGELNGGPGDEGEACYHLNPVGQPDIAYFALMFGDGRFVRYSVANQTMTAPGGGQVGMDEAALEQLYGPGIERSAHKYVEGGEYLRIDQPGGGEGVLIFETDAADTVTEWRVGLLPHVLYVEGCA
ncbi:lectin [Lysobacter sp. GX 14042]|uniref:lectin n=1 Tax=Lysobacter sp. GX 14042 TaxID=2907155 RepID=UPI001F484498|nr:lectin [Lysobacter sp. GX 14042]MCE7031988.1 lectin [Lysobacter sp. GX 14042]